MTTQPENRRIEDHWHLDKRVPIALVIMLAVQAMTAVWWASGMDSRVATLERIAVKNEGVEARLARIEEGQSWIKNTLQSLVNKLPNGR